MPSKSVNSTEQMILNIALESLAQSADPYHQALLTDYRRITADLAAARAENQALTRLVARTTARAARSRARVAELQAIARERTLETDRLAAFLAAKDVELRKVRAALADREADLDLYTGLIANLEHDLDAARRLATELNTSWHDDRAALAVVARRLADLDTLAARFSDAGAPPSEPGSPRPSGPDPVSAPIQPTQGDHP